MRLFFRCPRTTAVIVAIWVACAITATARAADDNAKNPAIDLADGKIVLTAPADWLRKAPKVRFIEHEFAVPAEKGDSEDGRVTVMGAGGSIEANIDRWIAQFSQADGSETKNQVAEADRKRTIAGLEVHFVDLAGTYKDMPRPFDPMSQAVQRKDYRMLAAIIASPKLGNYFIKFYGPKKTIAAHADEFRKTIEGMKVK
ncbi:MAG TPA: hypothetical protein VKB78_03435 [Pirellulales bacterium]|nr:hypothetical protein [Pirellulales bacterium]